MKVPKGMSDYQATWIVDEDEDETGEMNEESSEDDDDEDDMLDEAMDGEDEDNNSQVHIESIWGQFLLAPTGYTHDKRKPNYRSKFDDLSVLFFQYFLCVC